MLEIVSEITSTNTALLARAGAAERVPEGHWLIADRQTAGRGRAGRGWQGGAGNFMGSTLVWLRPGDPPPQTLALVAGLAAHAAVAGCAPGLGDLWLKWPNDLMLGGAKLGGILLERQGDAVVVGIGANLARAPRVPERLTASLADAGRAVARDVFAEMLAAQWAVVFARWRAGDWGALREAWLALAHPVGAALAVREPGGATISGAFAGLDPHGAALLRLADGQTRAIHAGDIEWVGSHAAGD